MAKDSVEIEFVKGQPVGERRGIAWLKIPARADKIDAKSVFEQLDENYRLHVHTSFGMWLIDQRNPKRHHGWDETGYKKCHVFKWNEMSVRHRLYGFKWNPGIPDGRFELCVVAMHTTKNEKDADPWYKNAMNNLRDDEAIQAAITKQVQDYFNKKGKQS